MHEDSNIYGHCFEESKLCTNVPIICKVDTMESNLNIRSWNEVALLPPHAVVMMELDLGDVMGIVIAIVMALRCILYKQKQKRYKGLLTACRKTSD
jgi:hypothetical protein